MEALTESLTTGFGDIAKDMISVVGGVVPKLLPVVASVAVVTLGIKIFRKVSH